MATMTKTETTLFKGEDREDLKVALLRAVILNDEECAEQVVPTTAAWAQVSFFEDEPLMVITFFTATAEMVETISF